MTRTTALLALATLLVTAQSHAQGVSTRTPERAALLYFDAVKVSDVMGEARLMAPSALKEFRNAFKQLSDLAKNDDLRERVTGVRTKSQFDALSDTALYAAVQRLALERDPTKRITYMKAEFAILGSVMEGDDTAHVVYRLKTQLHDVPVSTIQVISLARTPMGWRCLLQGDFLSAFATAVVRGVQGNR